MRFGLRIFLVLVALWLPCCSVSAHSTKKDRFYFERLGYAHWQVRTNAKVVALTFDDGPDPTYTPQILQLLAHYHDHGTFFVIGQKVGKYPGVAKQTVVLGNEIGNHTYSHRHIKYMSKPQLKEELEETHEAIEDATGQHTKFFRPPRGFYDESSVMIAHQNGYPVIMWAWDEDSRDWQGPGVNKIVRTVLAHVHPGDIILMHDGTGHTKQTIAALKIILPALHKAGYKSVTMSELLRLEAHPEEQAK